MDAGYLALSLTLPLPMRCLSAWRWRFTDGRLGLPLGPRRALEKFYLASLLNGALGLRRRRSEDPG